MEIFAKIAINSNLSHFMSMHKEVTDPLHVILQSKSGSLCVFKKLPKFNKMKKKFKKKTSPEISIRSTSSSAEPTFRHQTIESPGRSRGDRNWQKHLKGRKEVCLVGVCTETLKKKVNKRVCYQFLCSGRELKLTFS